MYHGRKVRPSVARSRALHAGASLDPAQAGIGPVKGGSSHVS